MKKIIQNQNKIHFTSLGCARNFVDTEIMLGITLKAGYEITQEISHADYLVINTCGFLESARQEALDTIDDLLKEKKTQAKLIVTGCMVQKHSHVLKEKFPNIHYLLGSGDVEKILNALSSELQGEEITSARSYLQWGEIPRQVATPRNYAYLKIAEGCAKRCSFCIIPLIKGPLKSKTQEQILKEFQALLKQGVHEVILIAQDLGDFGKERREKGALEKLLKAMLTHSKEDFWIRLLYLYPDEISDELISLMQEDHRLLHYLDMPIQHINSAILKAMRRKTSKEQILTTIEKLRRQIPNIVIRTSLMVGFPGETEKEFLELLNFIEEQPLDNIGVFAFSPEKDALASQMPNQVPETIKQQRLEILMNKQKQIVKNHNQKYLGSTLNVKIEGYHPESNLLLRGRFYGQCPEIDGMVIINDFSNVTSFEKMYSVKVTDVIEYDLIGQVVKPLKKKKDSSPLTLVHK